MCTSTLLVVLTGALSAAGEPTRCDAGFGAIPHVATEVLPSIVGVTTTRTSEEAPSEEDIAMSAILGVPVPTEVRVRGSGVVVDERLIITNEHVIDRANRIRVTLADGTVLPARVVGADTMSDIALLRVDDDASATGTSGSAAPALVPIRVGDSDRLAVGQLVVSVGNPLGIGTTVTMGVVSGLQRSDIGLVDAEDFIQTDAAINPGSSGGALVNMCGELVGINTATVAPDSGSQGIGFAIPTRMMRFVVDGIRRHGHVQRGTLGAQLQDMTPALGRALGVSATRGVVISDVVAGGAAARAHLAPGDAIVTVDGAQVDHASRVRNDLAALGPGARVMLGVRGRNGARMVPVTLGELAVPRPAAPSPPASSSGPPPASSGTSGSGDALGTRFAPTTGLGLVSLTPSLRKEIDAPPGLHGAVVTAVMEGSPASDAGLHPGDIIVDVGGRPMRGAADVVAALTHAPRGTAVLVRIVRDDARMYIGFQSEP